MLNLTPLNDSDKNFRLHSQISSKELQVLSIISDVTNEFQL
jgi:hypothetical protein